MCFLGEIFQEQGVHRALEADVQVRSVALGQRDDADPGEGKALEQPGGVFLAAAKAVQRLGEDIESAVQRIAHQRLETGTSSVAPEPRGRSSPARSSSSVARQRSDRRASDRRWTRHAGCPTRSGVDSDLHAGVPQ